MNSYKTDFEVDRAFAKWQDPEDSFSKYEFYNRVDDYLRESRTSYAAVADITGIKVDVIKDRINYLRTMQRSDVL